MQKVREGFLKLYEYDKQRIIIFDGNREIDEIEKEILIQLNEKIVITDI